MCVVKVNPSAASGSDDGEAGAAGSSAGSRSITGGALHASGSSGQLVPNLDGSGLVEIVSPHDVLQPGCARADGPGLSSCDVSRVMFPQRERSMVTDR